MPGPRSETAELALISLAMRLYINWRLRRRITQGVLKKVGQNLIYLYVVQINHKQIIWQVGMDGAPFKQWFRAVPPPRE